MSLKIMTWNIEQFGEKRSSEYARLVMVAKVIAMESPDIFVLIELKTTKPMNAVSIADRLVKELNQHTKSNYKYVLSYSNGIEMYAYFYKSSIINAFTLVQGNQAYNDPKNLKLQKTSQNTQYNKKGVLKYYFPLLNQRYRPPSIGFFQYQNKVFALLAWHNMANRIQAGYSIQKLLETYPSLDFQKISLYLNDTPFDIEDIIITGDFNIDIFQDNYHYYDNLMKKYKRVFNAPTHLLEYNPFLTLKNYKSLFNDGLDNFFVNLKNLSQKNKKVIFLQQKVRESKYDSVTYFYQKIIDQYIAYDKKNCVDEVKDVIYQLIRSKFFKDGLRNFGQGLLELFQSDLKKVSLSLLVFDLDFDKKVETYFTHNYPGGQWKKPLKDFQMQCGIIGFRQGEVRKRFTLYRKTFNPEFLNNYADLLLLTRWISDHVPIVLELD